jgi:hypothetical protein
MRTHRRPVAPAAFLAGSLALGVVVAACGSAAPSPAMPDGVTGLTTRFEDVAFVPGTTVIDPSAMRPAIRRVEPVEAGLVLRLDPGLAGASDLKVGSVALLGGAGPRTITGLDRDGSDLVVRTTPASLGSVIQHGTIGWTYALDWDQLPASAWSGAGGADLQLAAVGDLSPELLQELDIRGSELKFGGTIKGFEVEAKFIPRADKLDFELSAQKASIKVEAKGFISDFVQSTTLEYDDGEATLIETTNRGLRAEAEIQWAAFQVETEVDNDDITALDIPLEIPIPFQAGPVPMTLKLKAAARIVPAFNGEGSSGGSFKLSYGSDVGFNSNGGTVNPAAQLMAFTGDLGSKETVTASFNPAGFAVGFEFPRVELALGHPLTEELGFQTYAFLTINQYANGMFTPGTTLSSEIPPCQRASLQVSAIAGYKLSVLGFPGELSDNKLLWEKKLDKFKDGKPCTLTGSS